MKKILMTLIASSVLFTTHANAEGFEVGLGYNQVKGKVALAGTEDQFKTANLGMLGVELGYQFDYGQFQIIPSVYYAFSLKDDTWENDGYRSKVKAKNGYGVNAKFKYLFNEQTYVYLAPGYHYYKINYDVNSPNLDLELTASSKEFGAKAAVGYTPIEGMSVELGYQKVKDLKGLFAGVNFTF